MSKKSKSRTDLNALVKKYQRISAVSEIEKNLLNRSRQSFLASELYLSDVFDETNYDLSLYQSLEASLRKDGFLVPLIVVRNEEKDGYEIINGVKRFLLGKKIGLTEMPCILAELSEERKHSYIIENIQAENDCALVKTTCFKVLIDKYGMTAEDISSLSNISLNQVKNLIRLDQLPDFIKADLRSYKLNYAQARTLLGMPLSKQKALEEKILKEKISVRELEQEKRRFLGQTKQTKIVLKRNKIILTFKDEKSALKAYPAMIKEFSD
jgi:ParB/RepB/Spo0J family partition protein